MAALWGKHLGRGWVTHVPLQHLGSWQIYLTFLSRIFLVVWHMHMAASIINIAVVAAAQLIDAQKRVSSASVALFTKGNLRIWGLSELLIQLKPPNRHGHKCSFKVLSKSYGCEFVWGAMSCSGPLRRYRMAEERHGAGAWEELTLTDTKNISSLEQLSNEFSCRT